MKYFILLILIAGAVLFFFTLLKAKLAPEPEVEDGGKGSDYEALRAVLSPAERSFVGVLAPVLPAGVGILAKTRLADIFTLSRGLPAPRRQPALNRIMRKHVDFLLIRASDFSPIAGIELDDASPRSENAQKREGFVDSIFASSGIPLLRIRAQASYDPAELGRQIAAILGNVSSKQRQ